MASLRVGLSFVEDHTVMAPGETGDGINLSVDQLIRPSRSVKLAADIGKLLARVKIEVDLSVAEEVGHEACVLLFGGP